MGSISCSRGRKGGLISKDLQVLTDGDAPVRQGGVYSYQKQHLDIKTTNHLPLANQLAKVLAGKNGLTPLYDCKHISKIHQTSCPPLQIPKGE